MKSYAKIRKVFQLTQEQMAKLMSVSAQTISNWEQGREIPSRFDAAVYRRLGELATMPGYKPAVASDLAQASEGKPTRTADAVLDVICIRHSARAGKKLP